MIYKRASTAWTQVAKNSKRAALLHGDCRDLLRALPDDSVSLIVTSPPYCMGKEYEPGNKIEDFVEAHEEILPEATRVLRPGGSLCWQVGYHVQRNAVVPLDFLVYQTTQKLAQSLVLRNRIVWHFGHGQHCDKRFSGRHETLLWFTKGRDYFFDLDPIRVPQKYPGKRASRGPKAGQYSGNPLGKNPSDVWDIPNVKANHVEKTSHPCQFPVALVRRLVLSLTKQDELVLDPFAGVASTGVAALMENRRFLGAELREDYASIAKLRLREASRGTASVRSDKAVLEPDKNSAVARRPNHFWPDQPGMTAES